MKDFTLYPEALELKEIGFDEPCFGYFNTTSYLGIGSFVFKECDKRTIDDYGNKPLLRPTYSQAFRWFKEKYGDFLRYDWGEVPHFLMIQIEMTKGKTYEEAELACLRKLIEIVKKQNHEKPQT